MTRTSHNEAEGSKSGKSHYKPNHIPLSLRWYYGAASSAALAYGKYGVWIDDLYMPGKRGRGVHFHGLDAWLMYGALFCLVANFLSVIVDHFDQRNNERNYRLFAKSSAWLGYGLFGAALAHQIYSVFTRA
jgi:hypothetical protein